VKSDDPNRVRELLEEYSNEFASRFLASMRRRKNRLLKVRFIFCGCFA